MALEWRMDGGIRVVFVECAGVGEILSACNPYRKACYPAFSHPVLIFMKIEASAKFVYIHQKREEPISEIRRLNIARGSKISKSFFQVSRFAPPVQSSLLYL